MVPFGKPKLSVRKKDALGYGIIVLITALAVVIYMVVLSNVLSQSVLQNAVTENSQRTDLMYSELDKQLSSKEFTEINTAADKNTKLYKMLQSHLNEIRTMNSARYFYTAKRNSNGDLVYLVDGLEPDADDFRNPGDLIEDEMIPYLDRALAGETVYSQDIVDTTWGHIFTACYPIHDSTSGKVVGVLCIENDMESTYQFIAEHQRTLAVTGLVALAVIMGLIGCTYLFLRRFRTKEEEDQRKLVESYEQLEDALSRETKHSEIISALAGIYTTIFLVNLETHDYEIVESVELMHGVAKTTGCIDDAMEGILGTFITPEMVEPMRAFLDVSTLADRMGSENTVMTEYKNPAGRWFQARFVAKKRTDQGRVTEVLYAARDFTDEKKRELDLQDQLMETATEAKKANLSKTTFLRRMSHDIRTPLNGIIGMMHVSDKYANDPERMADAREKILHSADYLMDLVNNVLDISKLESGSLELENQPFNLGEMLTKTVSVVQTNAAENGIRFEGGKEASQLEHLRLVGSSVHLNRVLMNIASNAVKYNRPGGMVRIFATEIASSEDKATYRFVCEDTGLGMSEEFQRHAFEPFTQEGKETTTSFSGSGLGLSIVKDIVDMMGGTIELTSKENVGTTFTITVSFQIDHSTPKDESGIPQSRDTDIVGRRALVVEDNALNREIARIMLEEEGLVITEACNGEEAVEMFAQAQPGTFDYVFMDVMMPVMDGLEATRRIRALDHPDAKSTPIIAMTANAFAEDRQACLDAGMNVHVGKPIEVKALHEAIEAVSG